MKNICSLLTSRQRAQYRNILFLIVALTLLVYSKAAAEQSNPCHETGDHQGILFLLIDRSDKLSDITGFEQSLSAVRELVGPGERFVVGVSTGKLSETRMVLDTIRPVKSMWDSPLKFRAREKKFSECVDQVFAGLKDQGESHPKSAILETLHFVEEVLKADKATKKRVVIYSDMVQNSDSVSFVSGASLDVETSLKKVEKESLLYSFASAEILIAGAGIGVADQKARKIEQFWKSYFERSGAKLSFYGPILVVPS